MCKTFNKLDELWWYSYLCYFQYDIFNEVKAEYDKNAERQEQLRQFYDIRHIQDNLKVAALQAEEESESIAEKFLEGMIGVSVTLLKCYYV